MGRMIDLDDAIEAIAGADETDGTEKVFSGKGVQEILKRLPTTERKEGVWFHIETIDHITFYEHRECGRECKMPENFCPKCGAKMRMSWECFDEGSEEE